MSYMKIFRSGLQVSASLTAMAILAVAPTSAWQDSPNELAVTAGKSVLVASEQLIERVSVGFGDIAEATAITPTEVLVNGKAPGSTSLIIWQKGGGKLFFDVNVQANRFLFDTRIDGLRRELKKDLPNQDITLAAEGDSFFLRGTARDLTSVDRALAITSALGKVVNLLYVDVPPPEAQILLRVRFASIDRTAAKQLGVNIFSTGAGNTLGGVTTTQFPGPSLSASSQQGSAVTPFAVSDLLNIFLYRKDLNLGATIKALETKGVLQVLAEPNVLTANGKQGSFLAGGEFPYPVLQGGGGGGGGNSGITIQFREFGVRLNFIPTILPGGNIRLQVAPEVSSLDFANGLAINGFNIPALIARKVRTDVNLEEGQSFAIGGLLDKRVTETFEKVPFISEIPVLGKFFQSKSTTKQNSELIVIVTPELVHPIPAGNATPSPAFTSSFMESGPAKGVRTPSIAETGPVPPVAAASVPVETLVQSMKKDTQLDLSGSIGGKTASTGGQGGDNNQGAPLPMSSSPQK